MEESGVGGQSCQEGAASRWMGEDITDDGRRRYREQGGNTNLWAT